MLAALASGLIFGLGLVLAGMTQPAKVIAFLDVSGAWDPSLGFVMAGAIAVYAPVYQLLRTRMVVSTSDTHVSEPIDGKLIAGALIFGAGWGLGGFCPGPGFTAVATLAPQALAFAGSMLVGMLAFRMLEQSRSVLDQDGAFSVPPPANTEPRDVGAQPVAPRSDCA